MSRYKYKAWDLTNNEWFMDGDAFDLEFSGSYGQIYFDNDYASNIRDVKLEWLQCTGLKDKNGKLIFEGDIVKTYANLYEGSVTDVIIFENTCFRLKDHLFGDDGDHKWYSLENVWHDDIEIIGNIHENGDLINEIS